MIELSSEALQVISLLVAFVIPTLVAVVTQRFAASWIKSFVLIVLAALLAIGTEVQEAGAFDQVQAFLLFVQNVVIAIASHFGITKPSGLSGADSPVAKALPKGLG
jgi:hypothetical protein